MASGLQLIMLLCLASELWVGVTSCSILTGESCRTCPQGWIHFDKSCYLFQFTPMDWADAERHCTAIGGNLPSVHANDQYSFLRNTIHQLTGQHRGAWLGGYDAVKEGVWLWSDGSLFDFKHWAKGEPNDRSGKTNCMEMNFRGRDYINDTACNQKRSFFCEKNL
ncbi:galactose-specific lectin nattectin-like [Labrus bergylta]|uniref:galactose-specific lectin nattectin-like n=1 Tax=Labrus bergylta TaxID=56723 RepID=UPI00331315E9